MSEPIHILLVEDDLAIRETVAEVLSYEGFQVTCAANGAEALRRLDEATAQPGLILLDLMMPVMDGPAFRSAQRSDPRIAAIPVIVLSASAGAEATVDRMAPAAFLPKPFELERLLHAVDRYCVRH
ncbi:MAG: response regulator [Anaeromyxobacter sp.]|nr:response regulator [Anaeromyxobacter sp.]MBL0275124.1 response regulator [Anaeromyxobacter sp.]